VEVTEAQDEENLPKSDAMGVKRNLDINHGSPAKSETVKISIPYLEYFDQNIVLLVIPLEYGEKQL